jgi:hypothetical protein
MLTACGETTVPDNIGTKPAPNSLEKKPPTKVLEEKPAPVYIQKYSINTKGGGRTQMEDCAADTAEAFEERMRTVSGFKMQTLGKVYYLGGSGRDGKFFNVKIAVKTFFSPKSPHNGRLVYIEAACDYVSGDISYKFTKMVRTDRRYYTLIPQWIRDDDYGYVPIYTEEYIKEYGKSL